MKLAAISDIHGNLGALEAVLADIERRNVTVTVNLGDILSGPLQPRETAERLMELDMPTIAGNHERQVLMHVPEKMGASDRYAHERIGEVQRAWMESPGHRANILDCSFRYVGIGYAANGSYWTVDFGA